MIGFLLLWDIFEVIYLSTIHSELSCVTLSAESTVTEDMRDGTFETKGLIFPQWEEKYTLLKNQLNVHRLR